MPRFVWYKMGVERMKTADAIEKVGCGLTTKRKWKKTSIKVEREVSGSPVQNSWKSLGKHIFLELYVDDPDKLNDLDLMRTAMYEAAIAADTEPLSFAYYRFQPQGLSCVLLLAESHISVHTWPQFGYASFDMYTCGGNPEKGVEKLVEIFKPVRYSTASHYRGTFEDVQRHLDEFSGET